MRRVEVDGERRGDVDLPTLREYLIKQLARGINQRVLASYEEVLANLYGDEMDQIIGDVKRDLGL